MKTIQYGERLKSQKPTDLKFLLSKEVFVACSKNNSFEIIELRERVMSDGEREEIICARVTNTAIPSKNIVGIRPTEIIGIVITDCTESPIDVRTLRTDFPYCMHMNNVPVGEPYSLCLYNLSWSVLERKWTPEKFLARILWWLENTSLDGTHQSDQPLEQMFFRSSFTLVLPSDFNNFFGNNVKNLFVKSFQEDVNGRPRLACLDWVDKSVTSHANIPEFMPIDIEIGPIQHGEILIPPSTLGQFQKLLELKNIDFFKLLRTALIKQLEGTQRSYLKSDSITSLLIIRVFSNRKKGAPIERVQTIAFSVLHNNFVEFGEALGVLHGLDGKYRHHIFWGSPPQLNYDWKEIAIDQVEVQFMYDRTSANQLSGIKSDEAKFNGVISGLGSLGGSLAELWSKMGWGVWAYVDPDYLAPHNIPRHIGKVEDIGRAKTVIVREITNSNFDKKNSSQNDIVAYANDGPNKKLQKIIVEAELVVDVTSEIGFPRDLSTNDKVSRSVSIFMTPSGNSSTILLEDENREIRLDGLEVQYYRAIINAPWGEKHLDEKGEIKVGARCSDNSLVLPFDKVQMHAGAISQKLRKLILKSSAHIWIFNANVNNDLLDSYQIDVFQTYCKLLGRWSLIFDEGIVIKMRDCRKSNLPNETGGVILGYSDQVNSRIYIVDVLPQPCDSKGTPISFERGVEGLKDKIKEIRSRTGDEVNYIGEWHSHPPKSSVKASGDDFYQLNYLASHMEEEGEQALMMIVNENKVSAYLGRHKTGLTEVYCDEE